MQSESIQTNLSSLQVINLLTFTNKLVSFNNELPTEAINVIRIICKTNNNRLLFNYNPSLSYIQIYL